MFASLCIFASLYSVEKGTIVLLYYWYRTILLPLSSHTQHCLSAADTDTDSGIGSPYGGKPFSSSTSSATDWVDAKYQAKTCSSSSSSSPYPVSPYRVTFDMNALKISDPPPNSCESHGRCASMCAEPPRHVHPSHCVCASLSHRVYTLAACDLSHCMCALSCCMYTPSHCMFSLSHCMCSLSHCMCAC